MTHLFSLTPHPPYDFQVVLEILRRHTYPVVHRVYGGAYWRTLHTMDGLVLLRVGSTGDPLSPCLNVKIVKQTGMDCCVDLQARIAHILGIDVDLTSFYERVRADDMFWSVIKPLYGVRWLRTDTVYEALMMTIIEQQISWIVAQRAEQWLVEWGNHYLDHAEQRFYAFPVPSQIANATVDDLKPLKITFRRIQMMIDISQQIVEDTLDIERTKMLPAEEGYRFLCQIKGVGHWTAAVTLQRATKHYHFVADNDVALQAAVNAYCYGKEGKASAEIVRETFQKYGNFAGLAAHYTLLRWVLDRY